MGDSCWDIAGRRYKIAAIHGQVESNIDSERLNITILWLIPWMPCYFLFFVKTLTPAVSAINTDNKNLVYAIPLYGFGYLLGKLSK